MTVEYSRGGKLVWLVKRIKLFAGIGRVKPSFDQGHELGFVLFDVGRIRKRDDAPIAGRPFHQIRWICELEVARIFRLGSAMKNQLHARLAFGRNSKRDAIITTQTKTRRIPFDLFGEVRVRTENGGPKRDNAVFQRMIEVVEERLNGHLGFGHDNLLTRIDCCLKGFWRRDVRAENYPGKLDEWASSYT